jgi:threonine/homoserine/homoserine lactone efflux protein
MSIPVLQSAAPGGPELLVAVLTVLVPLAVSVYVYRDANRRGSRHALAWALGSFFGSLVVWILYFVVRDEVGRGRTA